MHSWYPDSVNYVLKRESFFFNDWIMLFRRWRRIWVKIKLSMPLRLLYNLKTLNPRSCHPRMLLAGIQSLILKWWCCKFICQQNNPILKLFVWSLNSPKQPYSIKLCWLDPRQKHAGMTTEGKYYFNNYYSQNIVNTIGILCVKYLVLKLSRKRRGK